MKQKKAVRKRIILAAVLLSAFTVIFLTAWTVNCESYAHVAPSCERQDLSKALEKEILEAADYDFLYHQTGLGRAVIDKLRGQGREQEIYGIQDLFFQKVTVECEPNTVISREEYLVDEKGIRTSGMRIPDVEDGDILITFCSHAFGWRNGHAALVVDAQNRQVLEAQVLGSPSVITSLNRWESYPSFVILRLSEADQATGEKAALYAREELVGVPYRLEAGIRDAWNNRKIQDRIEDTDNSGSADSSALTGTQCSHLVWYAYYQFGYDLDSDGGLIVTPRDIAESENLEIVQIYGMSETFFSKSRLNFQN